MCCLFAVVHLQVLKTSLHRRVEKSSVGFGAEIISKKSRDVTDLFSKVTTTDLAKFGLIPEFIGRLPVICTLAQLTEEALIEILTKAKNAIIKQFQKLFEIEGVDLKFSDGALRAIVQEALARKTGARGLRSILEENMLDIMYDVPSDNRIKEVVITEEMIVEEKADPIIVYKTDEELAAEKAAQATDEDEQAKEINS